jgi:ABC-type bacteriocin/lantibiotic exporter with double-glycine peptidase domain
LSLFNGFFKFLITTRASRLGERVVTTLRGELYQGLLRLPPERMAGASPGQFVAPLDYYQQKEDMTLRFQQVVREFFIETSAPKPS